MLIRTAGFPFARIEVLAADWQHCETAIGDAQSALSSCENALLAACDAALSDLPKSVLRTQVYNARKDFYLRRRLPTLSVEIHFELKIPTIARAIESLRQATQMLNVARAAFLEQYEKTVEAGYERLQALAAEPEFQRALLFASHELLSQLPRFLEKKPTQFTKKERQTALAVLQYATRMATRTVPLSRFATVSMFRIDNNQEASDDPVPVFEKSVVSPNAALLEVLYTVLLSEPVFYRSLSFILNPCIVERTDTTYRWLYFDGIQESFQEAPVNPLLDHAVGVFLENDRRIPFTALLKNLVVSVEAEPGELEAYLLELADVGFLEWVLPETGLSPDWCGGLYRYLGFLPAEPIIVETAALLQTLRTTARVLPYLPVQEAARAQCDTSDQVQRFFQKHNAPLPSLPPEQLFYEDVERPVGAGIPHDVLLDLLGQITRSTSQANPQANPPRQALLAFFLTISPEGSPVGFLEFARSFLENTEKEVSPLQPNSQPQEAASHSLFKGKSVGLESERNPDQNRPAMQDAPLSHLRAGLPQAGVLFQFFQQNGQWQAVVNAMYPSGGKMFARWQHLFPHAVSTWLYKPNGAIPFPWQGYFNANYQPATADSVLAVPGGRVRAKSNGREYLLGNVEVVRKQDDLLLYDRVTGQSLTLTDLGLEAPETRPPAVYLLWLLGVPFVSVEHLLPEGGVWEELISGVWHRLRQYKDNVVVARAAWVVEQACWAEWLVGDEPDAIFFQKMRAVLSNHGVPRHLMANLAGQQSRHFDRGSPLSILLFRKMLRQGIGNLFLTEFLPVPDAVAQEIAADSV
ncbi:MAG: lantibiotic dehydratase [Saprospiraceae bacterium]